MANRKQRRRQPQTVREQSNPSSDEVGIRRITRDILIVIIAVMSITLFAYSTGAFDFENDSIDNVIRVAGPFLGITCILILFLEPCRDD